MPSERYNRQIILWGEENQKKLEEARVLVVGSGALAQYAALNYAGLGIGSLTFMDNKRVNSSDVNEFLCPPKNSGKLKVKLIEGKIREINPFVEVESIPSAFEDVLLTGRYTVVVEATNSPCSKQKVLAYAAKNNIPAIFGAANECCGAVVCYDPASLHDGTSLESILLAEYGCQYQGNVTSGVIGGLVADETRKRICSVTKVPKRDEGNYIIDGVYMDFDRDKPLPSGSVIHYSLTALVGSNGHRANVKDSGKKVLVVGAGALGNFVALNLVLNKYPFIEIMDHDIIDETNLNRQPFFYGMVGEPKAVVLSKRLKEIAPHSKIQPRAEKFEERRMRAKNSGYAFVIGCVDNPRARYDISTFARRSRIPFIDGGVSEFGGQIRLQMPTKNPCIACQEDLEVKLRVEKLRAAREGQRQGCTNANASIVVPHVVTGSMIVDRMQHLSMTETVALVYSSLSPKRFYAKKYKEGLCGCYREYMIVKNATTS